MTARHRACRHHWRIITTGYLAATIAVVAVVAIWSNMLGASDRAAWASEDVCVVQTSATP